MYSGYRDLKVYTLSYDLCMEVFKITKKFPKEEKYSLVDQIRRSSRSIPANITEAWKKRRYIKMFISKLLDASGEAGETEVWLEISKDCGYLNNKEFLTLFNKYQEVSKMLSGMINKADRFCP